MFNQTSWSALAIVLFTLLIIWSAIWKGLALWRAAKNNDTTWYVIMLILNTAGILEIIYYFLIGNKKPFDKAQGRENG